MGSRDGAAGLTQSVDRALGILTCFSDAQPRLRVADLVRLLGLSQSTVSRLLGTLESLGFVERDHQTGLYQLGLRLVSLAGIRLNLSEVRRQAVGELAAVAAELGLPANLGILHEDTVFYLATAEGLTAPRPYTVVGKRNPLHCTALGRVLLAYLPEPEREATLARIPYHVFTPYTVRSPDELRPLLRTVLECGYAVECEGQVFGRGCVAAPVRDASGAVVAAVSVTGPMRTLDLATREAPLATRVIEMANRISHNLGFLSISPAGPDDGSAWLAGPAAGQAQPRHPAAAHST
jgi:DNA-binding IclR family transcriptional regulator